MGVVVRSNCQPFGLFEAVVISQSPSEPGCVVRIGGGPNEGSSADKRRVVVPYPTVILIGPDSQMVDYFATQRGTDGRARGPKRFGLPGVYKEYMRL